MGPMRRRTAMSSASRVLDRLDRPRQLAPDRWAAGCPICQSRRGRPVSVRELDDGRTLIYGFCGHEAGEIVNALGLQLSDLFPERLGHHFAPSHSRVPARDVLIALSHEADVLAILAEQFLAQRSLSEEDWQRIALCASRIGRGKMYVR